jgi:hypothetical protein
MHLDMRVTTHFKRLSEAVRVNEETRNRFAAAGDACVTRQKRLLVPLQLSVHLA